MSTSPPPRAKAIASDHFDRTHRTAELVDELHAIVEELEAMHPGRKFPLDGHLVGSIGEAAAEVMFDVTLAPACSAGHDAVAADGRKVEIKATYGTKGVAMRETSHGLAESLVVLRLSRSPSASHEVVYNGPLDRAWRAAGAVQRNGQAPIGLARLRALNEQVSDDDRVPYRQTR